MRDEMAAAFVQPQGDEAEPQLTAQESCASLRLKKDTRHAAARVHGVELDILVRGIRGLAYSPAMCWHRPFIAGASRAGANLPPSEEASQEEFCGLMMNPIGSSLATNHAFVKQGRRPTR